MAARNKRSLSGTSASDIGEPRRKEPRLEVDRSGFRDSNDTSTSMVTPIPTASLFNTSNTSGGAMVINVGGHLINGDYIVNTDEEKALAKEVYPWLAAPDPSKNYHAARETDHAQTGSWFICGEAFARWKAAPDRPLWLYGPPGCGKTIISSSAIEDMIRHCREQPSSACAYFFFDSRNGEIELSLHKKFIRSLVLQLWHQLGHMPTALKDIYGKGPSHPQPSLSVLQDALQNMIGEFQHVYVVIDALDECADRNILLRWVKDISHWPGGKLHILLSSRRERDIEDNLVDINGLERVSFAGGSANPDIVKFVDEKLVELIIWIKLDLKIRRLVRDALLEGADGSFRWVALQLKELSRCPNVRALKQKLRELPKDLKETYQQLLSKSSDSSQADDLRRFLNWVAFSARPITLEELAEVVTIDFQSGGRPCYDRDLCYENPRAVLTVCSGFVTEFEGIVKLSHMSVKDYLLSDQISSSAAAYYSINASQSHCLITQTCLAYLVHLGILDSLDDASVATLPLARYAAEHWTSHFRGCSDIPPPASLQALLSHLFLSAPSAYANWMGLIDYSHSSWMAWEREGNDLISSGTYPPLFVAALLGLHETVQQLLVNGTSVGIGGFLYYKALYGAACEGHHVIIELLLEHLPQIKLSAVEESCGTAYIVASLRGRSAITPSYSHNRQTLWTVNSGVLRLLHRGDEYMPERFGAGFQEDLCGGREATVRLLLHHGANVNGQDHNGKNALRYASKSGNEALVRFLVEHAADVNAQDQDGVTALCLASMSGHQSVTRLLLELGADTNAQDEYGGTILHYALEQGRGDVVRLLLEFGADINAQGKYGATALHHASEQGREAVVGFLVRHAAEVNAKDKDGVTALHHALRKNRETIVRLLIENGAVANGRYKDDATALHHASEQGWEAVVRLLFRKAADINAKDQNGGTALHHASWTNRETIVRLLIENGADVNARDKKGTTALHNTVWKGREATVRLLLENGADVNSQDKDGATALHAASRRGNGMFWTGCESLVQLLLENGADINSRDKQGSTALHNASRKGYEAVVRLLLESGADVNARDERGETALHIASTRGFNAILQLLLSYGASTWRYPELWLPFGSTVCATLGGSEYYR